MNKTPAAKPAGNGRKWVVRAAAGCAAFFLLSVFVFLVCGRIPKPARTELRYGETFPAGLELLTQDRQPVHIGALKGTHKVLFYLSASDAACSRRLVAISRILKIYRSEAISYSILWEGGIPQGRVSAAGIDPKINYAVKSGNTLSGTKPNAFLLGADNRVEAVTGYSYDDLPLKLAPLCKAGDLKPAVNRLIVEDALQEESARRANEDTVIMFLSTSCRGCLSEEQKLTGSLTAIRKKARVITVQPDYDQTQVFPNRYFSVDDSLAFFDVYRQQSRASKLPYFVVTDKNMNILKEFPDVPSLLRYFAS